MTIVSATAFTDSDGTSIVDHTPDTGTGYSLHAQSAGFSTTFTIESNRLECSSDNLLWGILECDDTFDADQYSEIDIVVIDSSSNRQNGPMARLDATNDTNYAAMIRSSDGDMLVYRWDSGTANLLQTIAIAGFGAGTWNTRIEVTTNGSGNPELKTYVNDSQIGSTYEDTDVNKITAAGVAGIRIRDDGTDHAFDNYEAGNVVAATGSLVYQPRAAMRSIIVR